MKRSFDLLFSIIGLVFLSPFFLIIAIIIKLDSNGPIFYTQERIGQYKQPFKLFKFRSMSANQTSKSLITIGDRDPRITKIGYFLRKYKIDELPQLFNVLLGNMSFVGPRPEVLKYVLLYSSYQQEVLNMKPGITDMASITYRNESELLAKQDKPEKYYIDTIMPDKLRINKLYQKDTESFFGSIIIILKTIKLIR
jgi:lipopolysaccharide/colanic/teichoic acid biosynthesis glycosyltransferase